MPCHLSDSGNTEVCNSMIYLPIPKISYEKQELLILVAVPKVQESFESLQECKISDLNPGCRNRGLRAKIQEFHELIMKAFLLGEVSADGKLKVCGCRECMHRPLFPMPTSNKPK